VPYLTAEAARIEHWRTRLDDGRARLRVGLAWSGNAAYAHDHNRSIPLAVYRGLEAQGCQFVSLQHEVRGSDSRALENWPGLCRFGDDIRDFTEVAALIRALDLVITVDTSFAHLAGALGQSVWVLLARSADWRWMLEREDSPWYPTARLYRQSASREWPSVLARVRADLEVLAAKVPTST
jgi:hypothetical protein